MSRPNIMWEVPRAIVSRSVKLLQIEISLRSRSRLLAVTSLRCVCYIYAGAAPLLARGAVAGVSGGSN